MLCITLLCSLLLTGVALAQNFTFTSNAPTQCETLRVEWTGGQSPYVVSIVPVGGAPRNFTLTGTPTKGNQWDFPLNFPFPQGQQLLMAMSDATGFGTGGTSDIFVVRNSSSGKTCDFTPRITPSFGFHTDPELVHCKPYPITFDSNASQPVTIYVFIPHERSFQIQAPMSNSNSYNLNTSLITAGSSVMFSIFDSQGRSGGTTEPRTVSSSNSTGCLTSNSTTSAVPIVSPKRPVPPATIGGIAIGTILSLFILGSAVLFIIRKRQPRHKRPRSTDLIDDDVPSAFLPSGQYDATPFVLPLANPKSQSQSDSSLEGSSSLHPQPSHPVQPSHQSRVILHSDITDVEDDVVELPPQYSESRPPIPSVVIPPGI